MASEKKKAPSQKIDKAASQATRLMSGQEKPLHSAVRLTPAQEAILKKAVTEAKETPAAPLQAPVYAATQKAKSVIETQKSKKQPFLARLALRPRLLPMTMVAAMAMLGIKVGDLMLLATSGTGVGYSQALAAGDAPSEAEMAQSLNALAPSAGGAEMGDAVQTETKKSTLGYGEEFSSSQVEVLQKLKERREELDAREKVIEDREALLAATELKLDQKLKELNGLKAELKDFLTDIDEEQEAQLASLVSMYEKMKPKAAASIFNELDMDVLINIITRMKEQKASSIIALMDVTRAQELTIELSRQKEIPELGKI